VRGRGTLGPIFLIFLAGFVIAMIVLAL